MVKRVLLISILLMAFAIPSHAQEDNTTYKNSDIPTAYLSVAVRQKEDGKLSKGIHIFQLNCWNGDCTLTCVTLNQCWGNYLPDDSVFYPKIERTSTTDGTLHVRRVGDKFEISEIHYDWGGEGKSSYMLGFKYDSTYQMANEVISFSGGYIKNSSILNKVIAVEYIPFIGKNVRVKLDCDNILVPGVDTTRQEEVK